MQYDVRQEPEMPDSPLHRLTHHVPGVPEHTENQPHTQRRHRNPSHGHHTFNHTAERPPRILIAWQRRIAALFGRDLPH